MRNMTITAATLGLLLAACAQQLSAHTGDVHAPRSYDPVDTDFGAYDALFQPDRIIEVTMHDSMRFDPPAIEVGKDEVVLFRVRNAGELMHEFVLGTGSSLEQHAEMMKKFPGMEHDEPYMAHVPPGEAQEILWKFDDGGEISFACLLPGHYDAGMKGAVTVR